MAASASLTRDRQRLKQRDKCQQLTICHNASFKGGKIGFSPDGLRHVRLEVSGTRMRCHKLMTSSLTHPNLFWRLSNKSDSPCCWVCHGRFHDILPKEYSGTFYEVPWGLFKGMLTNTQGQSNIVTHQTNIWNKSIYYAKRISFHTSLKFPKKAGAYLSGTYHRYRPCFFCLAPKKLLVHALS